MHKKTSVAIVINYLDKSLFALPLGSLQAELIVEQNWNIINIWNKNIFKVQFQEFLPPSPRIPPAHVPGIPKQVLDAHWI